MSYFPKNERKGDLSSGDVYTIVCRIEFIIGVLISGGHNDICGINLSDCVDRYDY